MTTSFFFYDLETTGVNPRESRIMQFAGQRTDMGLKPIGEPHNHLIRLTDDILPDPDAILITGITPQKTLEEGITEAEFLALFHTEIATPGTIFVGFNTVRFDDEFMRYLQYRNFYDPYEWQYQDDKSRWDLLDVVRMTRALRPEGINWPVDSNGKATNRLELLTALNGIEHTSAHDALSDVHAVIAIAELLRDKQPKLFDFLLNLRDKNKIKALVESGQPFLYSSGKYDEQFQKTTAVAVLAPHPKRQGALVFDLRYDATKFVSLTPKELAEAWRKRKDDPGPRLPVKSMQYNRCPAIAPLGVLDQASQERLSLPLETIEANLKLLRSATELPGLVLEALDILEKQQAIIYKNQDSDVDHQLYDGFFQPQDKTKMSAVRAASVTELADFSPSDFKDKRLQTLLPRYKARNYPDSMTDEDRAAWEEFRKQQLLGGDANSRAARYFKRLAELAAQDNLTPEKQFLLEELQLYGQSILPVDID